MRKGLLEGKRAIVTGASKGIGKGIAKTFLEHGASVVITGRSRSDLDLAVKDLEQFGSIGAVAGDVSLSADVDRMVQSSVSMLGGLDVVCSNAGIYPMSLIEDMKEAEWDKINAVNVKGMFLMVKASVPYMKERGGAIVVTSSITGPVTGFAGWSHYGATKAAQLGFVRSAAIELAKSKIRINAVQPGNVVTEGLKDLGEEYLATMAKSVPLGYLGETEDIGHAMAFLASDLAKYITGQSIIVDGGQILPESSDAMGVV